MTNSQPDQQPMLWIREGHDRLFCSAGEVHFRLIRRAIYGRTQPHADLDQFDAWGMDIIEGRA